MRIFFTTCVWFPRMSRNFSSNCYFRKLPQTNWIDTLKPHWKQLNLVTLWVCRKKIGRNYRYFERKLPGLPHLFIFLSLKFHFRVFSAYDHKPRFTALLSFCSSRWFQVMGISRWGGHCLTVIYSNIVPLNIKLFTKYLRRHPSKQICTKKPPEKLSRYLQEP